MKTTKVQRSMIRKTISESSPAPWYITPTGGINEPFLWSGENPIIAAEDADWIHDTEFVFSDEDIRAISSMRNTIVDLLDDVDELWEEKYNNIKKNCGI